MKWRNSLCFAALLGLSCDNPPHGFTEMTLPPLSISSLPGMQGCTVSRFTYYDQYTREITVVRCPATPVISETQTGKVTKTTVVAQEPATTSTRPTCGCP